jgi:hypothetical protein
MAKTPSKYDSIIVAEYERYKDDCGLKIGDHKILCKVFDAQDENLQDMLSKGYDVQAVLITDLVRENLNEFKNDIFARFDILESRISNMEAQLTEVTKTVDSTQVEIQKLKRINSWWFIAIRWVSGVVAAVLIAWFLFINYWHK